MTGSKSMRVFGIATVVVGLSYLYVPVLILVLYSFNESRLVSVWGGFSLKWYAELFRDDGLINAALNSLQAAFISATLAVVLGTLAALTLTRFARFRGRTLFSAMITAPLVMPEVITGLSLLLLFVSMSDIIGWPAQRGMATIIIAHVTFCTAFATVIISARLGELDPNLEHAAMDLGASRLKAFLYITLPIASPALLAAWLLTFTLSLDDLVIASFVSGPASTTLPMEVFSSVRLGVSPKINALATILIGLVTIGLALSWVIMARRQRLEVISKPG
ncbi:MAG: ABC transporter permease subunit [Gammaproteobacteria bacterium]|nr:ABC transporter permease subunit [Gammaproteobacteria bacterium]